MRFFAKTIQAKERSSHGIILQFCRSIQVLLVRNGDDWIWLTDHSNQIGQEKVLQIIGIGVSDLPPLSETLPRDKMVVLATIPGTNWTREDVRREYGKLAKRIGAPKFLLTDGAVELRESADIVEIDGKNPILLRDMKHYAANVFEKMIGKDERFQEYLSTTQQRWLHKSNRRDAHATNELHSRPSSCESLRCSGKRNEAMGARKPRHHPHLQTNHRLQRIRQELRLALKYKQKHFQQPTPTPFPGIPLPRTPCRIN